VVDPLGSMSAIAIFRQRWWMKRTLRPSSPIDAILRRLAWGVGVPFVRAIGRWSMTGLVVGNVIGAGIFGVTGELTRLLGRPSPLAMVVAALGMAVIMAAIAEVASQFSEAGGAYLYVRTSFGRLAGLLVGWFWLLSLIAAEAACASLFVSYAAQFMPVLGHSFARALAITFILAVPAIANCIGVRSGANFCNLFTVSKVLPLALLIMLGVIRFGGHFEMIRPSEITHAGLGAWLSALLLLLAAYCGCEDTLAPMGEVKDPRRTVPFALAIGLAIIAAIYCLLQFVTVATIGTMATDRPLVEAATVLTGRNGAAFVAVAVMISTYGGIATGLLFAPRLAYALSVQGDFPPFLNRLHPRYRTPVVATVTYVIVVWVLALSGTFLWLATLAAGAVAIEYVGICAALIRLRKLQPRALALRLPWGRTIAVAGILICLALLTSLTIRELVLMGVTTMIAIANWWWAKRQSFIKPEVEVASIPVR
jgi:APA family basic amino acid/polyamine antiporter